MKICFAICEYNPFHNGHYRHIEIIKNEIKPDITAVILSGNFTQRGEIAVMDKYTRAAHAVKAGADIVFELPTAFAVSPAEIFAKGGIKLINSIKGDKVLCFGTESAKKSKLIATASALLSETKEFKAALKEELKTGVSYITAKVNALSKMDIDDLDFDLLKSPNNILGIEYAKAVIESNSDIDLYPIIRSGNGYNDTALTDESLPSALAIRTALKNGDIDKAKQFVPKFVSDDMPSKMPNIDDLIYYSLLRSTKSDLRKITDCTEGLENRIKALSKTSGSLDELKDKLKTKRYTYTRINRILTANFLGIENSFVKKCLNGKLYLKVLAVNKNEPEILSYMSKYSSIPLITRKSDVAALKGISKECFLKDAFAVDVYNYITERRDNEYETKFI